MAFVSKIFYPDAAGRGPGAEGHVQVTLSQAEAARASNLSVLIYDAAGRFRDWRRVSDLGACALTGSGDVRFDWSLRLDAPDLGRFAVGLLDVAGAPPLRSFLSPGAPVTALDGPAAGSRAVACDLSDCGTLEIGQPPVPPKAEMEEDPDISGLVAGTLIETPTGDRPVETLAEGDPVTTWDGGAARVQLVLRRRVPADVARANRRVWPVRISAGAMGHGLPRRDLWVSPHHRMLYQSIKVPLMFGEDAVFVRAKSMAASFDRVHVESAPEGLVYYHLVLDEPQVIFAEGSATESAPPGPETLAALSDEDRQRLELFVKARQSDRPEPDFQWPTLRSWELMACVG